MTPAQIRILKDGFLALDGRRDKAAALFFSCLFEIDPGLKPLFPGDLDRRGARMMNAVALIVDDLHRPHVFMPALEALAIRYHGYGFQPSAYAAVGQALKFTARAILGDDFTVELELALDAVFGALSSVMIDAAGFDYRIAA